MALEGKLVVLREEQPEDMPRLTALRNDLETQAWSKTLPPDYTDNMHMVRFQAREFSYDPKEGRFIPISRENGEFAGSISYTELHRNYNTKRGFKKDGHYHHY